MKLAIIGSRGYPRRDVVRAYVQNLEPDTIVITGGWPSNAGGYRVVEATAGVDRWAYLAAEAHGLITVLVAGSKTKHGRMAGKVRNPTTVSLADSVVAFWTMTSRGTAHTLSLAHSAGKGILVIGEEGQAVPVNIWLPVALKLTRSG